MTDPFDAASDLPNGCRLLPMVLTGGQPSPAQLERLRDAGGSVVLDLRDPMERRPFNEADVVRRLGMEYVNVPVGPGTTTDATLDRVRRVLASAGDRTVLVHCASGNRVGAALIPFLMLDRGFEEEDAVNQAMRAGLRSVELLEWGMRYVSRHRA